MAFKRCSWLNYGTMQTETLTQPVNEPRSSVSWSSQNTDVFAHRYSEMAFKRCFCLNYGTMQTETLTQPVNEPRSSVSWSSQNSGIFTHRYSKIAFKRCSWLNYGTMQTCIYWTLGWTILSVLVENYCKAARHICFSVLHNSSSLYNLPRQRCPRSKNW